MAALGKADEQLKRSEPDPIESDLGSVDQVSDGQILGWARSSDDSDIPAAVDIFIDGKLISTVVANLYRKDLDDAAIQDGYAHFRFQIPLVLFDGAKHVIQLRHRSTGEKLANSPIVFREKWQKIPELIEKIKWINDELVLHMPSIEKIRRASLKTRRLAVVSTYHLSETFLDYHFDLRDMLIKAGFTVVIIHAGADAKFSLREIETEQCFLCVKKNIGYDFGSWAAGLLILKDALADVDETLLINDSSILLKDVEEILDRVRDVKCDIVGLTDSYESKHHLQSYFLWLGRSVCKSPYLISFMMNFSFSSEKDIVILEGELGFTEFFRKAGFSIKALVSYPEAAAAWIKGAPQLIKEITDLPGLPSAQEREGGEPSYKDSLCRQVDNIIASIVNGTPLNPTHFFWDTLVEKFDFPLVKRELILKNPSNVPSYFRMDRIIGRSSPDRAEALVDMIQRYGGNLVPYFSTKRSDV